MSTTMIPINMLLHFRPATLQDGYIRTVNR